MQPTSPIQPSTSQAPSPSKITKKLGTKYEFSLNQKLGSGLTGDVYVGFDKQEKQLVCVKVIDRAGFQTSAEQTKMLENQIKCQRLLSRDVEESKEFQSQQKAQSAERTQNTIIKILDVFDTETFCFIVAELCQGGDLYKFIKSSPEFLNQKLVKVFSHQLALALHRMKRNKIIHRDIKSENILLKKGRTKLGDFGFAIEEKKLSEQTNPLNIGSPLYMSIEALQKNQYSYKSDIFSYGIVLYEMLHKVSPWESHTEQELKMKMKNQEIKFRSGLSQEIKDLIRRCLQMQVEKRISIQEVLEHEFFGNLKEIQEEIQKERVEHEKIMQKLLISPMQKNFNQNVGSNGNPDERSKQVQANN